MAEKDPSATLISLLPSHGLLEENNCEQLVIWSDAPESIIQKFCDSILTLERVVRNYLGVQENMKEWQKIVEI